MDGIMGILHMIHTGMEAVGNGKEIYDGISGPSAAEKQFNDTSNDPGPLQPDFDPGTVMPYMQAQAEREQPDWCQSQDGPIDVNDLPETDPVCPITPDDLPDVE
jgi:hypothetical protein